MPFSSSTRKLLRPPSERSTPIPDPFQFPIADLLRPYADDAENSAILFGVPFDTTTLGRAGSRHAPAAIRDALASMLGYNADLRADLATVAPIGDVGDVDVLHTDVEATWRRITDVARACAGQGVPLVVLGGDHGLTFPVLRGVVPHHANGLGVINLDAHYDLRPSYHDQPASGVPFRYALERLGGAVRAEACTHIGMSGWANSRHAADYAESSGLLVISGEEVRTGALEDIAETAIARGTAGTDGIWLSVDIDVVDGAFAPGTGNPAIGGITSRELLRLVWLIAQSPHVVGLDVVEVAPAYDVNHITVGLAATAVLTFLAARCGLSGNADNDAVAGSSARRT